MWIAALVVDGHEWIAASVEFGRHDALVCITQLTLKYVSLREQGFVTDLIGDNDIILGYHAAGVSSTPVFEQFVSHDVKPFASFGVEVGGVIGRLLIR